MWKKVNQMAPYTKTVNIGKVTQQKINLLWPSQKTLIA